MSIRQTLSDRSPLGATPAKTLSGATVLRSAFGNSAAESKSKLGVNASGHVCPRSEPFTPGLVRSVSVKVEERADTGNPSGRGETLSGGVEHLLRSAELVPTETSVGVWQPGVTPARSNQFPSINRGLTAISREVAHPSNHRSKQRSQAPSVVKGFISGNVILGCVSPRRISSSLRARCVTGSWLNRRASRPV